MKFNTFATLVILSALIFAAFSLMGGFDLHSNDAVMGLYEIIQANGG